MSGTEYKAYMEIPIGIDAQASARRVAARLLEKGYALDTFEPEYGRDNFIVRVARTVPDNREDTIHISVNGSGRTYFSMTRESENEKGYGPTSIPFGEFNEVFETVLDSIYEKGEQHGKKESYKTVGVVSG